MKAPGCKMRMEPANLGALILGIWFGVNYTRIITKKFRGPEEME